MARKVKGGEGAGAPAWMATFADMMSLLLTFFVLLLSFAEMDIVKFKDAMGSINAALGFMSAGTGMFQHSSRPTNFLKPMAISESQAELRLPPRESMDDKVLVELKNNINNMRLGDDIEVEKTDRGVVMRVKGKVFFMPGTAELKINSHPIFQTISGLMRKFPYKVVIEGHTDNVPVRGGKYSNNWELSTARAYTALKFLQEYEGIHVDRIHIAGFGDTHPITSNNSPEGRSTNRRVEFVFYK